MFSKEIKGKLVFILVYVDDLLITGSDVHEIQHIKEALETVFTIKDLGPMKYFLGIEVARNEKGLMLHQRKFILDILKSAGSN